MTREEQIHFHVTARERHQRLVERLTQIPVVHTIAHLSMTEANRTKVVRARGLHPIAVECES